VCVVCLIGGTMAQGRCSAVLAMVAVVLVSAASVVQGASYKVGDAEGWGVPESPTFYATWAANKTFFAGDTLLFVYNKLGHNVLTVTTADYASCTLTSTNKVQTGNDSIALVAGMNSFVCGIPTHCSEGQKLSVNATAAAGSPLPITPPAPPTTSPDTTPNAASGTTITIFQVVAAAMVSLVALLAL